MKKVSLMIAAILICYSNLNAQKLNQGSLDFLKDEKELNIVLDFSNVIIDGKSEKEFLELQAIRGGEQWKLKWENEVKRYLYKKFTDNCNLQFIGNYEFRVGNFPGANYQASIKVINIDAYGGVDVEVIFTKMNSTDVLASTLFYGKGGTFGTKENLMGDGFRRAGYKLGKIIVKKLYKIEVMKAQTANKR
jgi:hypothetical protein